MLRICDFINEDVNSMLLPDKSDNFQTTPSGRKKIASKVEQKQEAVYNIVKTLDENELNYVLKNIKNYKQLSQLLKNESFDDSE